MNISALTSYLSSFDASNLLPSKGPVALLVSNMHFGVWVAALASFRVVLGGMVLVNPPSDTTGQGAVSLNNVYSQQTVFTIQWDGATDGTISTIVLWQINLTAFNEAKGANKPTMGDLEYITSQSLASRSMVGTGR